MRLTPTQPAPPPPPRQHVALTNGSFTHLQRQLLHVDGEVGDGGVGLGQVGVQALLPLARRLQVPLQPGLLRLCGGLPLGTLRRLDLRRSGGGRKLFNWSAWISLHGAV